MHDSINYRTVPVVFSAHYGVEKVQVGIMYVHWEGHVEILEFWINPFVFNKLDHVDRERCKAEAWRVFQSQPLLQRQYKHKWEEVTYG